jgi:hypothetical protein
MIMQLDLWYWGIILLVLLLAIYSMPFLMSLWIKPVMSLWGFIVGRRRRNALILPEYPEKEQILGTNGSVDNAEISNSPNSHNSSALASEALKLESTYLDGVHKKKIDYLDNRLDATETRIKNLDESYQRQQEKDRNNFPGNAYYATLSSLNKVTAKDFLLLLIISSLFIADTLIAQQVFTSLGLFPTDKYVIFGKEISLTFILGLFLTIVAALFLHILWDRKQLKEVKKRKLGMGIGLATLVLLAALRFISVVVPARAHSVIEMVLIFGWLMGIVIFYWLLGEIIGEDDNWYGLFIAIGLPVLLILVFFFGFLFLLEKAVEWLLCTLFKGWCQLGHTRTMKQKQNAEEGYQATLKGFYRGLTF